MVPRLPATDRAILSQTSPEALQEFKVETSGMSAEYGKTPAAFLTL